MGKKSKKRSSSLRRKQKEVVKSKMRKRVNRQTNLAMQRMRQAAMRQKGTSTGEEGEQLKKHEIDEKVTMPECDGVGDCCVNHAVILDPADVQRVLYNKAVQNTFGIVTTKDLYQGDQSILHYWIDKKSGVPMCVARRDQNEDGNEECVFLMTGEKDHRTCLLGDDKPTPCKVNPLRRVAAKDALGRMDGWRYAVNDTPCQICDKCDPDKNVQVKLEDYLVESGMEERYKLNDLYHGYAGWLVKNIKPEELRQLAAMIMFDFDSYSMDIGGMSAEEAASLRPAGPESAILSSRSIVENIASPEKMLEGMVEKLKETEDGGSVEGSDTGGDSKEDPGVESGD